MVGKALMSSQSSEHYTPLRLIAKVAEFFGIIDLDPCSERLISPNVIASVHYTKAMDGLTLPWFGNVYVNPPYGRDVNRWVDKCIHEHKRGCDILLLLPSRTDTQWAQKLAGYTRLYIRGRLRFGELKESAPFPSVLYYLGANNIGFYNVFCRLGEIKSEEIRRERNRLAVRRYRRRQRARED